MHINLDAKRDYFYLYSVHTTQVGTLQNRQNE